MPRCWTPSTSCPSSAFIDGSDKGDTNAKPEIWKERAKFDAAALKMQEDVAKLNAAAKTGNLDAIKAAAGAVGPELQGLPRRLPGEVGVSLRPARQSRARPFGSSRSSSQSS